MSIITSNPFRYNTQLPDGSGSSVINRRSIENAEGSLQFKMILNTSNISVKTPSVGIRPSNVAAEGNYVYLLQHGSDLVVFDVTDPKNAVEMGNIDISVEPNNIVVIDSIAYICTNNGRLYIIDCSDPSSLEIISNTYLSGQQELGLCVKDDYVYIASSSASYGFRILDVSDLENPVEVFSDAFAAADLYVEGNYAYVARYSGPSSLRIYDISDPESPSLVSQTAFGSFIVTVHTSNNLAFLGEYTEHKMHIVDISNPASPTFIKTIDTNGRLTLVKSAIDLRSENKLFVFADPNYTIYDISDLNNIEELARQDYTTGPYNPTPVCRNGFVSFPYVYTPDRGNYTLNIYAISDVQYDRLDENSERKICTNLGINDNPQIFNISTNG